MSIRDKDAAKEIDHYYVYLKQDEVEFDKKRKYSPE